jgi:hypothetical protein
MSMDKVCLLKAEFNKCPYIGADQKCNSTSSCSMMAKLNCQEDKDKYVRQSRWYEKYNR